MSDEEECCSLELARVNLVSSICQSRDVDACAEIFRKSNIIINKTLHHHLSFQTTAMSNKSITDSKVVLVVGATSGIGKSLALAILALPSNPTVIISGRRQERLDDIISEYGKSGRLEGVKMDVDADRASLKKTVEVVLEKYPKVRGARYRRWYHGWALTEVQLDTIIFSAGIQRELNFANPKSVDLDREWLSIKYACHRSRFSSNRPC